MGSLYIVSTPIGNLEDISIRVLKILFSCSVIACEDTRRTGQLIGLLKEKYSQILTICNVKSDIKPKLISYYDEVEEQKTYDILQILENESDVVFVSDAGTPLISDPGYKLVKAAIQKGVVIISIPGASALTAALVSSGLTPDNFTFLGYPPVNKKRRLELFRNLFNSESSIKKLVGKTVIFFESPHRFTKTLSEIKTINPEINIVIARELTKIYEEIFRGSVKEALEYFKSPKGEFVLLLSIPDN
jgi:16S rRNA (cytidine1402-2'-O)-methyltransferase